ncbi:MAG: hypothetical protein IJT41_03480 [Clostridia bacterium]|nr:hypothetical protein [Clostridia bacterium]
MKKMTSVFLAVLMLLSVLPFAAFAAQPEEKQVRFLVNGDEFWGIDFSDVIRDKATINKGKVALYDLDETNEDTEAIWDFVEIDDTGIARFFYWVDSEKIYDWISLGIYDRTVELRAENGNLFDDVASYSFSIEDVYESIGTETFWVNNYHPIVEVTKCDGDLVKEMEFCFAICDANLLPLTVDMDKEIELTAYFSGTSLCTYRLIPVRYDGNGTLTVCVRNTDGSEGAPLHNAEIFASEAAQSYSQTLYSFSFWFQHGLFRYKDMVSEGFGTEFYTDSDVRSLPVQTIVSLRVPTWMGIAGTALKIIPASMHPLFYAALIPVIYPFPVTRIYRALKKSLAAYGMDTHAVIREAILSGRFVNVILRALGIDQYEAI